jgi:hypothetical protein
MPKHHMKSTGQGATSRFRAPQVDLGKLRVGNGPASGGQPPGLGHFQGRIVGCLNVAVIFCVPVDAAQSSDKMLGGAASTTGVTASDGVSFDAFNQLVDF